MLSSSHLQLFCNSFVTLPPAQSKITIEYRLLAAQKKNNTDIESDTSCDFTAIESLEFFPDFS
jgi:hypothetical protein